MNFQRRRSNRGNLRAGVTLIEMLVVVTIIALFAAIVAPKFLGKSDQARRVSCKTQINNLITALGMYKLDTGTYPTTEQGLNALRIRPDGVTQWNGPYLPQDVPNDPWNHPYLYKYPGEHGDEPEIVSLGQDGAPGGDGLAADIVSWKSQ